jgi:SsrA-binding protein
MSGVILDNRKARFEYRIIDNYTAGMQLKGSEVKSIKAGKANISEAYCVITNGEVFIKNMHISEHDHGGKHNNHEPICDRKLLLNKKEINKLSSEVKQMGYSIIPLSLILSDRGLIKINISLAKGKKIYDKKESIKIKDLDREFNNHKKTI